MHTVEDDDTGSGTAMVRVTVLNLVDFSGRVFEMTATTTEYLSLATETRASKTW